MATVPHRSPLTVENVLVASFPAVAQSLALKCGQIGFQKVGRWCVRRRQGEGVDSRRCRAGWLCLSWAEDREGDRCCSNGDHGRGNSCQSVRKAGHNFLLGWGEDASPKAHHAKPSPASGSCSNTENPLLSRHITNLVPSAGQWHDGAAAPRIDRCFDETIVESYGYGWDDLLHRLSAHLVDGRDYGIAGENREPDGFVYHKS